MSEIRPTCINHGCDKPVAHTGRRYRPYCSSCHVAGYGKQKFKENVVPFKTGKCSNQDGHLGFECPVDYNKAPWAIGSTEIDHSDGNHLNNIIDNCEELCSMCHKQKGKLNGDFKKQNRYNYNKVTINS
jgi:hypothetical protein